MSKLPTDDPNFFKRYIEQQEELRERERMIAQGSRLGKCEGAPSTNDYQARAFIADEEDALGPLGESIECPHCKGSGRVFSVSKESVTDEGAGWRTASGAE